MAGLVPDTGTGSRVSRGFCWPAKRQGQGPAGPRTGSALLWADWIHRLWYCDFLAFGVCLLSGEAGPETSGGFLEFKDSGTGACPLVGGTGS